METKYDDNGERKGWWEKMGVAIDKIWNHRAIMKRTEFATRAAAFSHKYPHALVVLADPETDVIFVSFEDQHAVNRITDISGKSMKVVKKSLDGEEESIVNLMGYISSAIKDNHIALLERWKRYEEEKKNKPELIIETTEAKKKRLEAMEKIRREQEKTDIKTGTTKLFPENKKKSEKDKHIEKLKELDNK
jgi:hypothetical protein